MMDSKEGNRLAEIIAEAKAAVEEVRDALNAEHDAANGLGDTEADHIADQALQNLGRLDDLVGDHVAA